MVVFFFFNFHSQRSRPLSWAVTSQQMTNTSWQDLVTRKPPSMRSSTKEEEHFCWDGVYFDTTQQAEMYRCGKLLDINVKLTQGCLCWNFFVLFVLGFGVTHFCAFWIFSVEEYLGGTQWSSASFLRTSFHRHLVKSVHTGLNKTFYIYHKISIFSCPGCTCDALFLAHSVLCHEIWVEHSLESVLPLGLLKAHSPGWLFPKSNRRAWNL